jgi:hypothetical protein
LPAWLAAQLHSVACCVVFVLQVKLLKDLFKQALGEGAVRVDINTIDGFQVCDPVTRTQVSLYLHIPCLIE